MCLFSTPPYLCTERNRGCILTTSPPHHFIPHTASGLMRCTTFGVRGQLLYTFFAASLHRRGPQGTAGDRRCIARIGNFFSSKCNGLKQPLRCNSIATLIFFVIEFTTCTMHFYTSTPFGSFASPPHVALQCIFFLIHKVTGGCAPQVQPKQQRCIRLCFAKKRYGVSDMHLIHLIHRR